MRIVRERQHSAEARVSELEYVTGGHNGPVSAPSPNLWLDKSSLRGALRPQGSDDNAPDTIRPARMIYALAYVGSGVRQRQRQRHRGTYACLGQTSNIGFGPMHPRMRDRPLLVTINVSRLTTQAQFLCVCSRNTPMTNALLATPSILTRFNSHLVNPYGKHSWFILRKMPFSNSRLNLVIYGPCANNKVDIYFEFQSSYFRLENPYFKFRIIF